MRNSIPFIEQRVSLPNWHIAHILLLAQTSLWPIQEWRARISNIRVWQDKNADAITASYMTVPHIIFDVITLLGTIGNECSLTVL